MEGTDSPRGRFHMAKPIEPTPVLKGEDAKRLIRSVTKRVPDPKKEDFFRACDDTYRKLSQK
jgi:hypothetical protein